jgi:hypothetical protein
MKMCSVVVIFGEIQVDSRQAGMVWTDRKTDRQKLIGVFLKLFYVNVSKSSHVV